MVRFNYRKLAPEKRRAFLERLAEIVVTLKDKDQVRFFFNRLLTESEVVMLMRRWEIAEFLVGGLTYEQIQRKLGVGISTIAGVDRWLTDAAHEYQLIREDQKKAAKNKSRASRFRRHSVVDNFPWELQRSLRGDSRLILFRLLLGDF